MRLNLRAVGVLALAVAITCTDAPTAPSASRDSAARIGLSPSFSADAARAYGALSLLGFDVTSVRVRLTAADGRVATDTIIPFPTAQDTLVLDLSVQVRGNEESFTALLELRDATGIVLFSGTHLVTARVGALPGVPTPRFALEYSGPGRDARTISLTPSGGPVAATAIVPVTATAVDSAGREVGDLLVRWTSSDPAMAAVTQTGAAAAELRGTGRRGAVTITVVAPTGLTASSTLSLVPPATRLLVVAGDDQRDTAGRALPQPFVVEAQAGDGGPVPGVVVSFRAVTAGGGVANGSVTTDVAGRASTSMTLGRIAGSYSFEASSGELAAVSITATAEPAPAAAIAIVSGDGQRDVAGRPLAQPFVVLVSDAFGAPVSGATVEWSQVAGFGQLGVSRSITGADGRASASYVLGYRAGVEIVRASLSGVAGPGVELTVRSIPGQASTFLLIDRLPPTLSVGVPPANTIRVQLADAAHNPAAQAGVVVTATGVVFPGGAPPFTVTATSDAAGIATFSVPAYAGAIGTATVTLGALGFVTLELPPITFVTGPMTKLRIATQPSATVSSGAPLPVQPEVRLSDAGANTVKTSGVMVTAFVASGGGVLSGTIVVATDASGAAVFTDLAITGSPGQQTLGFSSPSLPDLLSDPIDLTDPPTALEAVTGFLAPDSAGNTVVLPPFKVRLVDANGQPVARAGVPITVSATAVVGVTPAAPLTGTLTRMTDASGVARFDDVAFASPLGDYTLAARADPTVLSLPVLTLVSALALTF